MSAGSGDRSRRETSSDDGTARQGSFFGRRKGHKLRTHQADMIEHLLPHLAVDIQTPAPSPLAELFGGAPALLLGIEDPASNAHAPNESLHEGDFKKLMASLVNLFENLRKIPGGRVK